MQYITDVKITQYR